MCALMEFEVHRRISNSKARRKRSRFPLQLLHRADIPRRGLNKITDILCPNNDQCSIKGPRSPQPDMERENKVAYFIIITTVH